MTDMHQLSSENINMLFDGMQQAANQVQEGYNNTMKTFNPSNGFGNDSRRADGYQSSQTFYYGGQQPMQQQMPPQYGYGYTEVATNIPYGMGMFGQLPTPQMQPQSTAYWGFYNQSYGK